MELSQLTAMPRTMELVGAAGATFENYFVNWPQCCPSRATLLTGLYAHNHGVLGNRPPKGSYSKFNRQDNLAVWLEDAGYRAGHVGKFLNGYGPAQDDPATPYNDVLEVPPGWTEWRSGSAGTAANYFGYSDNHWPASGGVGRNGVLISHGRGDAAYKTDVQTRNALGLIGDYAAGDDPFYLQVDYFAPHAAADIPAEVPRRVASCKFASIPAPRHIDEFNGAPLPARDDPSFNEADVSDKPPKLSGAKPISKRVRRSIERDYRCQLESLASVDEGVERIIDLLDATGELDNTYVVFISDNGYFHGQHRLVKGKNLAYEPSIRVPLMIRGPGVTSGVTVKDLATNADLAPTFLDLAGADPMPSDGRSLMPALAEPWVERGRELLIETNQYTAIRTARFKLVEWTKNGFVELYDLEADPFELGNVAEDPGYEPVRARLSERLENLEACGDADCRRLAGVEAEFEVETGSGGCSTRELLVTVDGIEGGEASDLEVRVGNVTVRDTVAPLRIRVGSDQTAPGPVTADGAVTLVDGRRTSNRFELPACG